MHLFVLNLRNITTEQFKMIEFICLNVVSKNSLFSPLFGSLEIHQIRLPKN